MSCLTLEAIIEAKRKELEVLEKHLKADVEKEPDNKEAKAKVSKKDEPDKKEGYESMTSQALYKECCARGISSKCKERNKAYLIKVLEADDTEKENANGDEWEGEEDTADKYEGKKASELYKMCVERKIKTKKQLKAADYIKLLKKADEEEAKAADDSEDDWGDEDDSEDDWEI